MTRKQTLACLKAAGAQNDRQAWTRLYIENRVSFSVAMQQWRDGQAFARFIAERDAALATEQTMQGEQTLVPGVAPITDKARAELAMAKPLRGGNKPPPAGGLFDDDARAQTDMFG